MNVSLFSCIVKQSAPETIGGFKLEVTAYDKPVEFDSFVADSVENGIGIAIKKFGYNKEGKYEVKYYRIPLEYWNDNIIKELKI